MTVRTDMNGDICSFYVEGDIDTISSPDLEAVLDEKIGNCGKLVLDLKGVDYISSAGIRVVIKARKLVGKDNFTLKNPNETVREVFRITGFDQALNIE